MKTLIEYAISCGNENSFPFRNEKWFGFTNETQSSCENENETIGIEKNEPKKNENKFSKMKKNEPRITRSQNRRNEPTLHTKWGTATVNPDSGYYTITGGEYKNKLLHRLIFEDFYGVIPENHVIHHKNRDKLCNCILNLQIMSRKNHYKTHLKAERTLDYCLKESKAQNTTGYFRVSTTKCSQCKQGFIYRYQYRENNIKKAIFSTDLKKLEQKVKEQKLPWRKIQ